MMELNVSSKIALLMQSREILDSNKLCLHFYIY